MLTPEGELEREIARLQEFYDSSGDPNATKSSSIAKPFPPNFGELVLSSLEEDQHLPGIELILQRLSLKEFPEWSHISHLLHLHPSPKRHVSLPTAIAALEAVRDVILLHPPSLVLNLPKVPREEDEFRVWDIIEGAAQGLSGQDVAEMEAQTGSDTRQAGRRKRAAVVDDVPVDVRQQYAIRILDLIATILERDTLSCRTRLSDTLLSQSLNGATAYTTTRDAALKLVALVRVAGRYDGLDALEYAQRVFNQHVLLTLGNWTEFRRLVETIYGTFGSLSWEEVETFYLSAPSPTLRLHLVDMHLLSSFRHSLDIPEKFGADPSWAKLASAYVRAEPRSNLQRAPVAYARETYHKAFLVGEYVRAAEEIHGGDSDGVREVMVQVEDCIARRIPGEGERSKMKDDETEWWDKVDDVVSALIGE
ncbi:hypothetical protein M427DRAFT_52581 [Gonapodya prolifera JEL478]|uniref:Uncharacterized protein n=1 Tax=Gonapodya prolifera (strain JEL478) TaxID=1344416 RepID=A0A139ASG1_GONPJ|nr:hypothetical protein M427DRAFT_52581 [Gonapodya prolifera JEL478]|eukprot:KXS19682.1 hypothetical protein M427DRAFT_52581 [Gonapodya prolifera JEL478]